MTELKLNPDVYTYEEIEALYVLKRAQRSGDTRPDVYTADQIEDKFRAMNNPKISQDCKDEMLSFLNGIQQFMYNMQSTTDLEKIEKYTQLQNYPDHWNQGYNEMVRIFQKHNF